MRPLDKYEAIGLGIIVGFVMLVAALSLAGR